MGVGVIKEVGWLHPSNNCVVYDGEEDERAKGGGVLLLQEVATSGGRSRIYS
jgi:hypothetical protein